MPATQSLTITAPRSGPTFLADVKDHVEALWRAATLPATAVGGTTSAITATVTPAPAGLVDGLSIWLPLPWTPATGATLKIGALAAKPLARSDGVAIARGDVGSGLVQVIYLGGKWRLQSVGQPPAAGCVGAMQVVHTRTSLIPSTTLDAAATSAAWRGRSTAAGVWRLRSLQIDKRLGWSDACVLLIQRVR